MYTSDVRVVCRPGTPVVPCSNPLQPDERVASLIFPAATLTSTRFLIFIRRSMQNLVSICQYKGTGDGRTHGRINESWMRPARQAREFTDRIRLLDALDLPTAKHATMHVSVLVARVSWTTSPHGRAKATDRQCDACQFCVRRKWMRNDAQIPPIQAAIRCKAPVICSACKNAAAVPQPARTGTARMTLISLRYNR